MKNLSKKAVILSLSLVVVSPLVHKINAQDIEKIGKLDMKQGKLIT